MKFIKFFKGSDEYFESQTIHLFKKNIRSLEIVIEIISKIDRSVITKYSHFNINHEYILRKKNLIPIINDLRDIIERISVYFSLYLQDHMNLINKTQSIKEVESVLDPLFFFYEKTVSMVIPLLRNEINHAEFHEFKKFNELNRYLLLNVFIKYFKVFPSNHLFLIQYLTLESNKLNRETEDAIEDIFNNIITDSDLPNYIHILKKIQSNFPNSLIKHQIYDSIIKSTYDKFCDVKEQMTPNELISTFIFFVILDNELVIKDLNEINIADFGQNFEKVEEIEPFFVSVFYLLRQLYERQINQFTFVKDFCINFFMNHSKYKDHLSIFKNKGNLAKSLLFLTDYKLTNQEKEKIHNHVKDNIQYLMICSELNKENLLKSLIMLDIFDNEIYYELLDKILEIDFKYINRSSFYDISFVVLVLKLIKLPQITDLNRHIIKLVDQIEEKLISALQSNFLINNKVSFFERSLKKYLDEFDIKLEKNFMPHKLFLSYSDFYSKEKNLIIELDGPTHFITENNKEYSLNQVSSLKKELINKLGYNLISIPFYEWQELINTEEKINYLKNKFAPFNIELKPI